MTELFSQTDAKPVALPWRVLIVDDSAAQRLLLRKYLTQWGYAIREAECAETAFEALAQQHFDLILSDWMMPGLTGPEFCKALRAQPERRYSYFILLTSKSEKSEIAEGLEAGADDFLSKPIAQSELRARLQAGARLLSMQHSIEEKNATLAKTLGQLTTLYAQIDRDLIEARKLQQSLVRERQRDFGVAQVASLLRPSGHVGGDLVGYALAREDRLILFSIDVSGHGVASAIMAARLAGMFSQEVFPAPLGLAADSRISPLDITRALNAYVTEVLRIEQYLTWTYAELDLGSGEMRFVQAGHPNLLRLRPGAPPEPIGRPGYPIGLLAEADWQEQRLLLASGDKLLFLSDGLADICDARNAPLGEAGVASLIAPHRHKHGKALLDAFEKDLLARYKGCALEDDISMLLLEWQGRRTRPPI